MVPGLRVLHNCANSRLEDKLERSIPRVDQGEQHSRLQLKMQYSFDIDPKSPSCVASTYELQIHHARYMPEPDLYCHFSSSCLAVSTVITSSDCLSCYHIAASAKTYDRSFPFRGIAKEVLHCRLSQHRMTQDLLVLGELKNKKNGQLDLHQVKNIDLPS